MGKIIHGEKFAHILTPYQVEDLYWETAIKVFIPADGELIEKYQLTNVNFMGEELEFDWGYDPTQLGISGISTNYRYRMINVVDDCADNLVKKAQSIAKLLLDVMAWRQNNVINLLISTKFKFCIFLGF